MATIITQNVDDIQNTVASELVDFLSKNSYKKAGEHCLAVAANYNVNLSGEDIFKIFFLNLWFIDNSALHGLATSANVRDVLKICHIILLFHQ